MHHMSFYWSTDVGVFMFPGLTINGVGPLVALCVVLIIFALIYESVKVIQTKSNCRKAREVSHGPSCPANSLLHNDENQCKLRKRKEFCDRVSRISRQTSIFLFQTILGYLLMLTVMVYNAYVFLVVVFGFALGYFFFGHLAMGINMENIRARKTRIICSSSCPSEPSTSTGGNSTDSFHSRQKRRCEAGEGYTNELAISSSSSSLSNSFTQTTQLDKEIDFHHAQANFEDSDTNIIQSCRL